MTNIPEATDADREAAKRFVYDYNVRDIFQAREGPIEDLADIIARARAEEREACAKLVTVRTSTDREGVKLAAAIRARGEGGKA